MSVSAGPAFAAGISTPEDPNFWSVLPPILAIVAALVFRQVLPALFAGIWLGAWLAAGATIPALFTSFLDSFAIHVVVALANPDHAKLILFTMMIGGMVGIITRNGGLLGIVNVMTQWASSKKRAQLGTSFLGLAIFFDDYSNTLIVGNTMRPIMDHQKISREKLSYIVDSTAAPVACLALVSTWVGYEVGLIDAAIETLSGVGDPYIIFINSIAYSFYPVLALFFVLAVASTGRDFGPMRTAELAAHNGAPPTTGSGVKDDTLTDMEAEDGAPPRPLNALLPIGVLLAGVFGGLLVTGTGDDLQSIIGSADSFMALMWGSLLGAATAFILTLGQGILTLDGTLKAWTAGVKYMMVALIVLVLAWALASVTNELGTANYLIATISGAIPVQVMPTIIFVISAAAAFATGSSWSVMGILMPLAIPLVGAQISVGGIGGEVDPAMLPIFYSSIACVLAGSVWGDHCSPISDTTILSSLASDCDHIEHVRTQMPYALLVGAVAILLGTLPAGFGLPWWLGMIIGAGVLYAALKFLGERAEAAQGAIG